jgi:predicted amidohydrolase YtcJ
VIKAHLGGPFSMCSNGALRLDDACRMSVRVNAVVLIGNGAALDQLLDAVEAVVPAIGRGVRLEHADVVSPAAARRLAALKLPVCANSPLIPRWEDPEAFPLRRLIDAGVSVCLASD